MKNEKVSVIVPVYNVEKYLEKCLNSIVNQTYKNIEIILVNDGSTDNSLEIMKKFKQKDDRIILLEKENGGLSDARNYGLKKASGSYISFVDSDDFINEKMLEILVNNLIQYKADISMCQFKMFFYDTNKISYTTENNIICYNKKEALKKLLNSDETIGNHAWNKLYKKELFDGVEYPKGKNFEDIGTTYKLFDKSKVIVYTDFMGYYYYQRENSITGNLNLKSLKDGLDLEKERYSYLIKKYPELKRELLRNRADYSLMYIVGLAKINEKNVFKEKETYEEYKILKSYIKQNGMKDIFEDNSNTYKIFAILLMFNKKIFFYITSNLFKINEKVQHRKK